MAEEKEKINHPEHYGGKENLYEAIKVIEAWQLGYCLGNVIKYICRAGKKDNTTEKEDLKKAKWFLKRRISEISETKIKQKKQKKVDFPNLKN